MPKQSRWLTPAQQQAANDETIAAFRKENADSGKHANWTDDEILREIENEKLKNAFGGSYNPNYKKTLKRFRKLRKNRKSTRNQKRLRKHVRKNKRTLRYKKA
jgi:hypothetical protein